MPDADQILAVIAEVTLSGKAVAQRVRVVRRQLAINLSTLRR